MRQCSWNARTVNHQARLEVILLWHDFPGLTCYVLVIADQYAVDGVRRATQLGAGRSGGNPHVDNRLQVQRRVLCRRGERLPVRV